MRQTLRNKVKFWRNYTTTPVHTTKKTLENAALFLRLGLPSTLIRHENAALFLRLGLLSTLIRHENAAFRKRPSNGKNIETPPLRFIVNKKRFETELYENDDVTIIT